MKWKPDEMETATELGTNWAGKHKHKCKDPSSAGGKAL